MKINTINNQIFEAKKFRLPIKTIDYSHPELMKYAKVTKNVCMYKEFSNPNAENLYKLAEKTNDIKEKIRLYQEMGDYTIINAGDSYKAFQKSLDEFLYGKGIMGFFRKLLGKTKPLY